MSPIEKARKHVQAWEYEKSRANLRLLQAMNKVDEARAALDKAQAHLDGAEAHLQVVEDTVAYAEERIKTAQSYLEWLEKPDV